MREIKFKVFDTVSKNMSEPFQLFGKFTLLGVVFAWLDHVRDDVDCTAGIGSLDELVI